MEVIDKAVIVTEIKRLIDSCYKVCAGNLDFLKRNYPERYYSIETYKELLSFLDTLEVKRVELIEEKACDAYCKVCGHYAHDVPTHICRHSCRYYEDFKKYIKE